MGRIAAVKFSKLIKQLILRRDKTLIQDRVWTPSRTTSLTHLRHATDYLRFRLFFRSFFFFHQLPTKDDNIVFCPLTKLQVRVYQRSFSPHGAFHLNSVASVIKTIFLIIGFSPGCWTVNSISS